MDTVKPRASMARARRSRSGRSSSTRSRVLSSVVIDLHPLGAEEALCHGAFIYRAPSHLNQKLAAVVNPRHAKPSPRNPVRSGRYADLGLWPPGARLGG